MDAGCFSAVSFGEWILLAVEIVRSQIVINILDFKILQKNLLKVSSHSEKRTQQCFNFWDSLQKQNIRVYGGNCQLIPSNLKLSNSCKMGAGPAG